MPPDLTRTPVGIVGGGPAGLMLSHLLSRAGIDSVVVELRTREEIEHTHRAGILEQDSVRLLVETGVSDRVLRDGYRHEGIDLAFGGEGHRIDFEGLVGASVQLYPQTDVFIDLADARERDGGDVRYDVSDVSVVDVTSDQPRHPVHRRGGRVRRRSGATTSSAPTARAASAATASRRASGASTSGSTRSPGSASSARRRPAHPS